MTPKNILLTDSRALTDAANTTFIALRTAAGDGHRFVAELYRKGVRSFIVEDNKVGLGADSDVLVVPDTLKELQRLGRERRESYPKIPVIAITGSYGKTIVKEWLNALLAPDYHITRSPRSYNSQTGVPLSLWQLNETSTLGVFEAGISQVGEMYHLEKMLQPDIVIVTSIGGEHSEGFVTRQQKVGEKLILARNAKTLIYPDDDTDLSQAARGMRCSKIGWSLTNTEAALFVQKKLVETAVTENGQSPATLELIYRLRLNGKERHGTCQVNLNKHWEINDAVTCLATLLALGLDNSVISQRMPRLSPLGTRMQVSQAVNNSLIVYDDYTNDLLSLPSAIDFARRRLSPGRHFTAIIEQSHGDEKDVTKTFDQVVELLKASGVSRIIGIGPDYVKNFPCLSPTVTAYATVDDALRHLSPSDFADELILIKGEVGSGLERIAHMLEARSHETVLEVDLDAMVSNYNFFRSKLKPTTGIVAMVKASGYGAGSFELAKTLQSHGASYLAVAVTDEGAELRQAGITMPIMVLNPKVTNYRMLFANNLEPEIFSFEILDEIIAEANKQGVRHYPIHIKLDTGMHRLGFLPEELPELLRRLKGQKAVSPASVFSHLATADCLDMDQYTLAQLELFSQASQQIIDAFPGQKILRHILNTAGILRFPQYQFDMARLGIGLYGIPVLNNGTEDALRPVSRLRTVIISIKSWPAGTAIGYGRRGMLHRPSRIATIPIGYADGIDRHLGCGAATFLVNGTPCPTVGNICMDVCMIDITDAPANTAIGDSVVIFGPEHPVTVESEVLSTIPYELLTSVSPRVRRVYLR